MNLNLDYKGFESNLVSKNELFGGVHYVFRFANNYGASVIKHDGSYGHDGDAWELAVILYENESNDSWHLNYDTPITDDVIGWQTDEEIRDLLKQIEGL